MDSWNHPAGHPELEHSHEAPGHRVLMVSAEIFPLAKTGGLGDVCAALPRALAELGLDLRLLMPGYTQALDLVQAPRTLLDLGSVLGVEDLRLVEGRLPDSGLPVWLVDAPRLYRRAGTPYQSASREDWPDNALRFAVLSHVALRVVQLREQLGWAPEIVHCHDWHTGLTPWLLRSLGRSRPASVFTIHNAAFQGNYPLDLAPRLGLPQELLGADGIEFYGQLSLLKAGIRFADRITTVSPGYAREITTPEFGCGLDGLLRARGGALSGILNGIDTELWNPLTDPHIAHRYGPADRSGKQDCKRKLQQQLGLAEDPEAPLAIMVNRLTRQKMADVTLEQLPGLLHDHPDLQFAMLGQGDTDLERGYSELAQAFRGRVSSSIGYCEPEAHRLQAGGDLLLHGSRYEPCGLTQMYAMRYGTLPVVRRVGGLADSVVDAGDDASSEEATGFCFDEAHGEALRSGVERGLRLRQERAGAWQRLQQHAMSRDFGWRRSAQSYRRLYGELRRALPPRTIPEPDRSLVPA